MNLEFNLIKILILKIHTNVFLYLRFRIIYCLIIYMS